MIFEKLVVNLHGKEEYLIHLRNLQQSLNYGLVSKKVHKTIKFDRIARLKPYLDLNTDLTIYKDLKIILRKIF